MAMCFRGLYVELLTLFLVCYGSLLDLKLEVGRGVEDRLGSGVFPVWAWCADISGPGPVRCMRIPPLRCGPRRSGAEPTLERRGTATLPTRNSK